VRAGSSSPTDISLPEKMGQQNRGQGLAEKEDSVRAIGGTAAAAPSLLPMTSVSSPKPRPPSRLVELSLSILIGIRLGIFELCRRARAEFLEEVRKKTDGGKRKRKKRGGRSRGGDRRQKSRSRASLSFPFFVPSLPSALSSPPQLQRKNHSSRSSRPAGSSSSPSASGSTSTER